MIALLDVVPDGPARGGGDVPMVSMLVAFAAVILLVGVAYWWLGRREHAQLLEDARTWDVELHDGETDEQLRRRVAEKATRILRGSALR